MALRTLRINLSLLCFLLLAFSLAQGCFGPKLFVGFQKGAQNEVMYALITLYIKEKTGVESTLVSIEVDQDPIRLIEQDQADLVFTVSETQPENIVFHVEGLPVLVSGERPYQDLQFTTVLPALEKLNGLLGPKDVSVLTERVEAGQSAMSVVREFLMKNRWI
jgi:hypothetical protein